MTTRIDRRFAALRAEGRAALVTFVMAGDPDAATSLAIVKALPKAGADVIEIGMPFSDPMADGPAIQAAGLRALHGGQTLRKTLALARAFRETDADTPIVLMGYYNPIYVYGVDAFLRRRHGGRRRRADRRRSAARGGRRNCACRRLPPGSISSAWRRRRPTTSACRRCSPTPRASSTTSRSPALPARRRPIRRKSGAAVARIKRHTASAGGGRIRRQGRGERGGDRATSPTASWSARRWSRRCALRSSTAGRAPDTVAAVASLVADDCRGRAWRRQARPAPRESR